MDKKKVLLIGDPHFKTTTINIMKSICEEIIVIIKERKIDLVICLGDVLHTHEKINVYPLVQAVDWFLMIALLSRLVIIIGNHDRPNNNDFQTRYHAFGGLRTSPNITIVDRAIYDREFNSIYVPYVPPGRFREALKTINYDPEDENCTLQPSFICCHQEFENVKMGAIISKRGDKWSSKYPIIYTGHEHDYQLLPNIICVGSLLQHKFGECADKALILLNTSNIREYERIVLKAAPRKKIVHLSREELFGDYAFKLTPGYKIKVFLHVEANEIRSIKLTPQYKKLLTLVNKIDFKIEDKGSLADAKIKKLDLNIAEMTIENIMTSMLSEDNETLELFKEMILT